MSRQYAYFNELPAKASFSLNGTACIKQSSRTARMPEFNRWFYFGMRDLCIVAPHSRLDANYFEAARIAD